MKAEQLRCTEMWITGRYENVLIHFRPLFLKMFKDSYLWSSTGTKCSTENLKASNTWHLQTIQTRLTSRLSLRWSTKVHAPVCMPMFKEVKKLYQTLTLEAEVTDPIRHLLVAHQCLQRSLELQGFSNCHPHLQRRPLCRLYCYNYKSQEEDCHPNEG